MSSIIKLVHLVSILTPNSLNFTKTPFFLRNTLLLIKNYPFFIKNYPWPPYKKFQPLISAFIKNSIFGINRDPCAVHKSKKLWTKTRKYGRYMGIANAYIFPVAKSVPYNMVRKTLHYLSPDSSSRSELPVPGLPSSSPFTWYIYVTRAQDVVIETKYVNSEMIRGEKKHICSWDMKNLICRHYF